MNGCLVVNKPSGPTSHDVVDIIRKNYRVKTGHAGTLDPMAQGVLVIFLQKGLKVLQFIPPSVLDKTYLMRVRLGTATDTYDATGTVTSTGEVSNFSHSDLLRILPEFVGTINQVPPAFSAIKVEGNRSYSLARAGKAPTLSARKVHIDSMRLLKDYRMDGARNLVFRLHCSRGTYVRSIAHDLGQKLGCGAHLSYLFRERVGIWSHTSGFPLWKIKQKLPFEDSSAFTPVDRILPFTKLIIQKDAERKITNGAPLEQGDIKSIMEGGENVGEAYFQIFSATGIQLALYGQPPQPSPEKFGRLIPVRVLI